jgi:hypothetical protein
MTDELERKGALTQTDSGSWKLKDMDGPEFDNFVESAVKGYPGRPDPSIGRDFYHVLRPSKFTPTPQSWRTSGHIVDPETGALRYVDTDKPLTLVAEPPMFHENGVQIQSPHSDLSSLKPRFHDVPEHTGVNPDSLSRESGEEGREFYFRPSPSVNISDAAQRATRRAVEMDDHQPWEGRHTPMVRSDAHIDAAFAHALAAKAHREAGSGPDVTNDHLDTANHHQAKAERLAVGVNEVGSTNLHERLDDLRSYLGKVSPTLASASR